MSRAAISIRLHTSDRVALGLVALLAILMRVPGLAGKPGYDWDEPVYANIAGSLTSGDGLYLKPDFGAEQAPYLYHPPFYFWLLSGWMRVFGEGIGPARWLAAVMSIAMLALLFMLMRRRWGALALIPLAVLATDGWLVFSNRVSWIENSMLVLAAAAILVYDSALRTRKPAHFAAAGVLVGATFVFKHVGVYVLLAVLITWAVVRTDKRGHLTLLASAGAVIVLYAVGMTIAYGSDFLQASTVQFERLTGNKEARGSIGGPGQVIEALLGQYKLFAMTLLLAGLALLAVARRAWLFIRRREMPDPVLFGWAAAAAITFAASGLKMAHYFMMIEIPLFMFLFSELTTIKRRAPNLAVVGLVVVLAANFLAFDLRIATRTDNALAQVRDYAAANLEPDALILTEETVGAIVPQPYCKFHRVAVCASKADYVIVYLSLTQAPPDTPQLRALLARSREVARFKGFKETLIVFATPQRAS